MRERKKARERWGERESTYAKASVNTKQLLFRILEKALEKDNPE